MAMACSFDAKMPGAAWLRDTWKGAPDSAERFAVFNDHVNSDRKFACESALDLFYFRKILVLLSGHSTESSKAPVLSLSTSLPPGIWTHPMPPGLPKAQRLRTAASRTRGVGAAPNVNQVGSPGDLCLRGAAVAVGVLWIKESGVATNTGCCRPKSCAESRRFKVARRRPRGDY